MQRMQGGNARSRLALVHLHPYLPREPGLRPEIVQF
jgi:hypothetical protein